MRLLRSVYFCIQIIVFYITATTCLASHQKNTQCDRKSNAGEENCKGKLPCQSKAHVDIREYEDWEFIEDIEGYDPTHVPRGQYGVAIEKDIYQKRRIIFPNNYYVFAPTSKVVKSELCRRQSAVFKRDLKGLKMWAMMMYDATAKLPSGILLGNGAQMGTYDECLRINTVMKNVKDGRTAEGIRGKYCLASFDISATADHGDLLQAVHRSEFLAVFRSTINDTAHGLPRVSTLVWGLCVPAACSPRDVQSAVREELTYFNESFGVHVELRIEDDGCVDKENMGSSMGFLSYLTISILIVPVILTIRATIFDHHSEHASDPTGKLNRILMSFSLKRSWKDLTKPAEIVDVLESVHLIKALLGVVIYYGHKMIMVGTPPYVNRVEMAQITYYQLFAMLRMGVVYVDVFLFLSGTLFAFSLTKELMTKGKLAWVRHIVMRFIRFTPPLLILVLFYGYVSENIGSGPLWRLIVGKNAELCRRNGWANLLHLQNLVELKDMCAPHTHQLAVDTQLAIFAPILVYVLYHFEVFGVLTALSLFVLSGFSRYHTTYDNELTTIFYTSVPIDQLYRTGSFIHAQSIQRASPYVYGLLLGYFLKKYGTEFRGKFNSKLIHLISFFSFVLFASLFFLPKHVAYPDYVYDKHFHALVCAVSPMVGAISFGWFIVQSHLGYSDLLTPLFRHPALLIFSRITYSLFLVQFIVFHHTIGITRAPTHFHWSDVFSLLDVFSVMLATIITLVLDYPVKEILKILSTGKSLNSTPGSAKAD